VNGVMNAGNFLTGGAAPSPRQPAAWVSVTYLKVLILAVLRYANVCTET